MNQTAGKICVALTGKNCSAIQKQLNPVQHPYDVVEIRLDGMEEPNISTCLEAIPTPLLFTNRPVWEGGAFTGPEQERLSLLYEALELHAPYIDVELKTEHTQRASILRSAEKSSTQTIVSNHNFDETPDATELLTTLKQMQDSGANIGKIITTAQKATDVSRVLNLLDHAHEMQFPLIAFCMGTVGRISRFATLFMGGYMSYLALDEAQATAPGQFSLDHFHGLLTQFHTPS